MLYILFLVLALAYNWRKFAKERVTFLSSLIEAKNPGHREMILSHHFYIFIFEGFLALIVAHLITEKAMDIGILGLGLVYVVLIFLGFFFYKFFVRYLEKQTNLEIYQSFKGHLFKDFRVNFAIILLPILVYSLINYAFQDSPNEEAGGLWFIGLLLNVIFVSVLTIVCSVIIMLRLIPNREITEPEYLDIINKRLEQIKMPNMRIRWIETDIKNAFVVGLKLLSFSNQTMFIGRSLRTTLTMEEFDAVIAHELAHIANRHIQKRVIGLMKNFLSVVAGCLILTLVILGGAAIYWGEDFSIYASSVTTFAGLTIIAWIFFTYSIFFDSIRSHEFEADAYAVMELGASFEALSSALEKLTNTEELPEYLKKRTRKKLEKNFLSSWFAKNFSTHPDLETRIRFLDYKIAAGLPFNHYVSTPQKIRMWLGNHFTWKIYVPMAATMALSVVWVAWNVKTGREQIDFIHQASSEEIIRRKDLISEINSKPLVIGQSLMYFIVKKNDPELIDHFIKNGASKGRTLLYIALQKDFALFERYYSRYQDSLTEDEYFLMLSRTAEINFTDGYRMLVNAKRFEDLDPTYKADLSRMHSNKRAPASAQK